MANDGNLYFLLMAEILMIVHLACDKGVCSLCNCLRQEERACASADGNGLDGTAQKLIALHTLDIKRALQHQHKVVGGKRLGQLSYNSAAALDAHNRLFCKETAVMKLHFFSYLEVNTATGIVHVSVHGNHRDIIL